MLQVSIVRIMADFWASIRLKTPAVFSSVPLFRMIMSILECHTFRLPVRRFVIDLFDKDLLRQIVLEEESDEESEPSDSAL